MGLGESKLSGLLWASENSRCRLRNIHPSAVLPEPPYSLRRLAEGESRQIDETAVLRRLRAAWVTRLEPYSGRTFSGLTMWFGDFPISIDNAWSESSSPVADAVDEAVRIAERWDLQRRLHSAWMDMDQIVHATRALMNAAEARGREGEVHPLAGPLREVLETGIVTMYARHFDGDRQLPRRWWPKGKRKVVHDGLIARRNTVVAHADETTERQLVTLPTAGSGPRVTVVAEARRGMSTEDLVELIRHCEALWARYSDAVLELKRELGIAASGELYGPAAYDE